MKKILIVGLCALLLTGCGEVKLDNGENAIVSFNNGDGVTAQELYDELKEMYGVNYLVNLIDSKLLDLEYEETTEELEYVQQIVDSVKSESGDEFLSYIEYYYGVNSEEAFEDYIKLNYRRSLWIEDYANEIVTDKQIEDYYNDVYVGDMEVSHILIMSDATSDMSDDEKKEAETEAYNEAKEIIERLNNGEDFATLAKEYSDDSGTASDGGVVGIVNYGMNYDEDFVDAAAALEEGKYSSAPVKTQFGYHIIYKTKQNEKESLEDSTDTIREIIANESLNNNTLLYSEALEALREKYEMDIVDSSLKSGYENYLKEINTAS
mgnify:CR=1 FL=1